MFIMIMISCVAIVIITNYIFTLVSCQAPGPSQKLESISYFDKICNNISECLCCRFVST